MQPEPVNTDPVVSPKKSRRGTNLEKAQKPPTVSFAKEYLAPSRAALPKTAPTEPETIDAMEEDTTTTAPKTPAVIDLFSPPSQPSTERAIAKDTPPPSDLTTSTRSIGMQPVSRVARRARAVVNYAEPSLISKMRRPTKELVDAVGKDGRPIPGSIVRKDAESTEQWQPKTGSIQDPPQKSQRDEAPSPLGSKTGPVMEQETAPLEILNAVRRPSVRQSISGPDTLVKKLSVTATKPGAERSNTNLDTRRRKIDDIKEAELAVYDFRDSSPLSQSSEDSRTIKAGPHRRHSSMVDVRSKLEEAKSAGPGRSSSNLLKAKAEVSEDVLSRSSRSIARRKSMMI
jgi:hypothetical protein